MPIREVANFSVQYMQVLDETGTLDPALDPKLPDEKLLELYRWMVIAREADDRMLKLQRQGRLGTFPPCIGQEASVCGPTLAMQPEDWFVGAFREVGGRLMRGEPLTQVMLYYNGWEEGNYTPKAPRTLPIYVIIASQLPHAVGIAYKMKLKGERAAVVCFMGDGATSEGDFSEGMNFAAVWKVPVVFICQNNQWAISVPLHKQTASRTIAQKAIAFEMPGIQVDGNDALGMYLATRKALERAYRGEGPTFIEALTYRLKMHTTADDPSKYRNEEEVEPWLKRDPLIRMRLFLGKKGLWNDEKEAALWQEAKAFVEEHVKAYEAFKPDKLDAPFDHVYATKHALIEQQRAEFLAHHSTTTTSGQH